MKDQASPGPWKSSRLLPSDTNVVICDAEGTIILQTMHGNDEANGMLAATAPELRTACEAMVHAAKLNDPAMGGVAATLAAAALAKAAGKNWVGPACEECG